MKTLNKNTDEPFEKIKSPVGQDALSRVTFTNEIRGWNPLRATNK
jgi:hypothetical protein